MQVTVVGGGVLGASAALALARDGHEVTLREKGAFGAGASSRAAGILSVLTWNDDDLKLIARTRNILTQLQDDALVSGKPWTAWKECDSILVAPRPIDALANRARRHQEDAEVLDVGVASRRFPGVAFRTGEHILESFGDGVIEAGDLMEMMRWALHREGVQVQSNDQVQRVPSRDGDITVVAGGAWTPGVLAASGFSIPAVPYRTQAASLTLPGAGGLPIVHDLVHHFYGRPESAESALVGDGTQLRAFDPANYNEAGDAEFLQHIAEAATTRFKHGAQAHVRASWAGLPVGTPDRRPLCGKIPGAPGLFVLTGDNGFGLMRGLALGERLAKAVRGTRDAALDPARFGWPAPTEFELREGYGDLAG